MDISEVSIERNDFDLRVQFKSTNASKNYYKIEYATNPKEVGKKWPQVKTIDLTSAHSLNEIDFPSNNPNFESIEVYPSTKLTDLISTGAISAPAFILSQRAIDIFLQYNLGNYRLYPATIKLKDSYQKYKILHFINDFQSKLDYSLSKFYVADFSDIWIEDIMVKDYEEYLEKSKIIYLEQQHLLSLKLGYFKPNIHLPDIFSLASSSDYIYISRNLGQAIIDNHLSGFELHKIYNIVDRMAQI